MVPEVLIMKVLGGTVGSGADHISVQFEGLDAAARATRSATSQVTPHQPADGCDHAGRGLPGTNSQSLLPTVGDRLEKALTAWRQSAEDYAAGLSKAATAFRQQEADRASANHGASEALS